MKYNYPSLNIYYIGRKIRPSSVNFSLYKRYAFLLILIRAKIFLLLEINACSALNLSREKISPSASRIIKRVTTLEVYQEELVERTTEGTVSSAFPVFQRSNLAIFRGEAPSRKIGVRAANQRCFMQPPRLKEILSNISCTYEL